MACGPASSKPTNAPRRPLLVTLRRESPFTEWLLVEGCRELRRLGRHRPEQAAFPGDAKAQPRAVQGPAAERSGDPHQLDGPRSHGSLAACGIARAAPARLCRVRRPGHNDNGPLDALVVERRRGWRARRAAWHESRTAHVAAEPRAGHAARRAAAPARPADDRRGAGRHLSGSARAARRALERAASSTAQRAQRPTVCRTCSAWRASWPAGSPAAPISKPARHGPPRSSPTPSAARAPRRTRSASACSNSCAARRRRASPRPRSSHRGCASSTNGWPTPARSRACCRASASGSARRAMSTRSSCASSTPVGASITRRKAAHGGAKLAHRRRPA